MKKAATTDGTESVPVDTPPNGTTLTLSEAMYQALKEDGRLSNKLSKKDYLQVIRDCTRKAIAMRDEANKKSRST